MYVPTSYADLFNLSLSLSLSLSPVLSLSLSLCLFVYGFLSSCNGKTFIKASVFIVLDYNHNLIML